MANELPDLKAKIDEEPLNAARTDQQVLDWLNETETGPWLDVSAEDMGDWAARWKLPGRLFAVRNETYDNPRSTEAAWRQRPRLWGRCSTASTSAPERTAASRSTRRPRPLPRWPACSAGSLAC